jgi:hypothetical protein
MALLFFCQTQFILEKEEREESLLFADKSLINSMRITCLIRKAETNCFPARRSYKGRDGFAG